MTSQILSFQSQHELIGWLIGRNIDLSQWGKNDAKSVDNLWKELVSGECHLSADAVRTVRVVSIIIRRGNRILVEAAQQFQDGRVRMRNRPPSEKLFAGENFLQGAIRCLAEELNVSLSELTLLPDTHRIFIEKGNSYSYPQLTSQYELHHIEAIIPSLPDRTFTIPNVTTDSADTVISHRWEWQETTGKLTKYRQLQPA